MSPYRMRLDQGWRSRLHKRAGQGGKLSQSRAPEKTPGHPPPLPPHPLPPLLRNLRANKLALAFAVASVAEVAWTHTRPVRAEGASAFGSAPLLQPIRAGASGADAGMHGADLITGECGNASSSIMAAPAAGAETDHLPRVRGHCSP